MRRTSVDPAKNEGRPMQSYATPLCPPDQVQPAGSEVLTYVSSPSDVTFLIISGKQLREKSGIDFFKDDDLVICFKGSSTMENFKHDLYSQFNATELTELMPADLNLKDNTVGKVTGAFVKPLMEVWPILKREIASKNPKRLFITGHSLGGAYASLFAFIVAECHAAQFPTIKSAHLITFGAPTLLSDTARNTFNKYLDADADNEFILTLDRVVSQAQSLVIDAIPSIPAGFSHPGFQPLKTEFYPEEKTGRAYQLKNIEGVFKKQSGGNTRTKKGGLFGFGAEKNKYEEQTKLHMPTKIMIVARNPLTQTFPHAEYWDMTYLGGFRMLGMKNPGYKGNTFVGRVYSACISYAYEPSNSTNATPDAHDNATLVTESGPVVQSSSDEAAPAAAPLVAAAPVPATVPVAAAAPVPATVPVAAAAPVAAAPVPAATTVAVPAAAPAAATTTPAAAPVPAATTVPAGGRKTRKHRKGNKGNKGKKGNKSRRVSRRKHRRSHTSRHY
jgi:hypothetical protein